MKTSKKFLFTFKMTIREFSRGQFLYVALFLQVLILCLASVISQATLDDGPHIYDATSYFVTALIGLLTSAFIGSFTWSRDASKSGLSEILCHFETTPFQLYLFRLISWSVALFIFNLLAFSLYCIGIFIAAPDRLNPPVLLVMALFTFFHCLVALKLSMFLGTLIRPPLAFLSSILLFSFGNLSETLTGVLSFPSETQEVEAQLPLASRVAIQVFQFWKPELLVVNESAGNWILPEPGDIFRACAWAFSVIIFLTTLSWQTTRRSVHEKTERW